MIYVMSDVHGRLDRWKKMLELIDVKEDDEVWVIGDVIDRGPNGVDILLDIMGKPNFHLLMGNHELMMLDALASKKNRCGDDWGDIWEDRQNGGGETILDLESRSEPEFKAVIDFVRGLKYTKSLTVADKRYLLVHGSPVKNFSSKSMGASHDLVWSRIKDGWDFPKNPELTWVVGHTPTDYYSGLRYRLGTAEGCQEHSKIYFGKGFIDVDCGCATNSDWNRLGCLRLDDMKELYV